MTDIHIVEMLEERPFSSLSPADIARAESHVAGCGQCQTAYSAARIASVLIEVRASEAVEVSPFFKTQVMATIRERRLSTEVPALVSMWRAASALVSTIGILLVILTGITIFSQAPDTQMLATEIASQNLYSPEYVVLDLDYDELANDQVIPTMYDLEDTDGQ